MALLLEAGGRAGAAGDHGQTPLHCCCERGTDDDVQIATMLLDAGAYVNCVNEYRATPLLLASHCGSAALVALLLARGANVRNVNSNKQTALMLACDNGLHGPAIIELLVAAGGDVNACDDAKRTALVHAFNHSGRMVRALAPYVSANDDLAGMHPAINCVDPIGAVSAGAAFGARTGADSFAFHFSECDPAALCWAQLRGGAPLLFDGTAGDIFVCMEKCTDVQLWRLVVGELLITRHPITHDTLLHVAARASNMGAVHVCCSFNLNPLLRNAAGQLALECATDAAVQALLARHALWRPTQSVTQWFGPYFQRRARTWLLLCARWGREGTRTVQRDVQLLIVSLLADAEETFVRSVRYVTDP